MSVTGRMNEDHVWELLTFAVLSRVALGTLRTTAIRLWRAEQHGIIGVSLDVFLQILGAFESFTAEVALVRLQGNVNTNMRSNVITLNRGSTAVAPLASEIQVVGALAANMALANVVLWEVSMYDTEYRVA